ncbi:DUF6036 family nucleotidyltransferase [Thermodesulfobacteriota bacterium]
MKLKSLEIIVKALNKGDVRYLIAGGLAVVAHGNLRFTADIDLILDMSVNNLRKAMKVFDSLGYRPRAPVDLMDFIDSEKRKLWVREKGLAVFSMWNSDHPATEVDLFIEAPMPFEKAYSTSMRFEVAEGVEATVIGLHDLILLKKKAGRAKDLDDIEKLNALIEDSKHE